MTQQPKSVLEGEQKEWSGARLKGGQDWAQPVKERGGPGWSRFLGQTGDLNRGQDDMVTEADRW